MHKYQFNKFGSSAPRSGFENWECQRQSQRQRSRSPTRVSPSRSSRSIVEEGSRGRDWEHQRYGYQSRSIVNEEGGRGQGHDWGRRGDGGTQRQRSKSPVSRSRRSRSIDQDQERGRKLERRKRTRNTGESRLRGRGHHYKVLCISSIPPKVPNCYVSDQVYQACKDFARNRIIQVRVVREVDDERVAYVYFDTYAEAKDAFNWLDKNPFRIWGHAVKIEAARESEPEQSTSPSPRPTVQSSKHRRAGEVAGNQNSGSDSNGYMSGSTGSFQRHFSHEKSFANLPRRSTFDAGFAPGRAHDPPAGLTPLAPPTFGLPSGSGSGPLPIPNSHHRFPNHLQFIPPEDDPLATRTLFVGNLNLKITESELRRIFGQYGTILEVDIKSPSPSKPGNKFAFIKFLNLDMAATAKSELSGQYIGTYRCKIGYGKLVPSSKIWIGGLGPWTNYEMLLNEFDRFGLIRKIDWEADDDQAWISYSTLDGARAAVQEMRGYRFVEGGTRIRTDFATPDAESVWEIMGSKIPDWIGKIDFRNTIIPTKLFHVYGEGSFEKSRILMEDAFVLPPVIQVKARLKIEEHLDYLATLFNSFKNYGVFLAASSTDSSSPDSRIGSVGCLVSYLKEKRAAATFLLKTQEENSIGRLYAFPQCEYSLDLLKQKYPDIEKEQGNGNEYLVFVLFMGNNSPGKEED